MDTSITPRTPLPPTKFVYVTMVLEVRDGHTTFLLYVREKDGKVHECILRVCSDIGVVGKGYWPANKNGIVDLDYTLESPWAIHHVLKVPQDLNWEGDIFSLYDFKYVEGGYYATACSPYLVEAHPATGVIGGGSALPVTIAIEGVGFKLRSASGSVDLRSFNCPVVTFKSDLSLEDVHLRPQGPKGAEIKAKISAAGQEFTPCCVIPNDITDHIAIVITITKGDDGQYSAVMTANGE